MNELRNLIEQRLTRHHATSASAITKKPLNAELTEVVLDCCLTWLPEPREVLHLSKPVVSQANTVSTVSSDLLLAIALIRVETEPQHQ